MTWTTQPRSKGAGALAYWRAGDGPPLILIHGVGLRAEAWGALAPGLTRHLSVFAVDLPGHGQSPLGRTAQLADYKARLLDLCHALDGTVAVAGHSMGAMIALEMAARAPDKFKSVAALNAIYRRTPEAAAAVQARAAALSMTDVPDPKATLQRWFGAESGWPEASPTAAKACRRWLTGGSPAGYATARPTGCCRIWRLGCCSKPVPLTRTRHRTCRTRWHARSRRIGWPLPVVRHT